MKIQETYIVDRNRYIKIEWLAKEIYSNFPQSITGAMPRLGFVTIHKTSNDKWFFEFPDVEYGSTIYVYRHIAEIKLEITPGMIYELEK